MPRSHPLQEIPLPIYSLFIRPPDLQELRRDIWCDDPLPAKLKVAGKQYDIDIAYRGAHTRKLPKKSYHIQFYRPASFHGAREIHLNAEYNDRSLIRNRLSLDFFRQIGCPAPEARHVMLMINGAYAGIYLQLESVDERYLQKRGWPQGAIYYAVNDDANFSLNSPIDDDAKQSLDAGYDRMLGTDADNANLRALIYKINTWSNADFASGIAERIDVDLYLRWLTGAVCTQNFDGFIQNYTLIHNPETGRYTILPWDYDATWGRDVHGATMEADYIPITGYNTLTARLLSVPEYRRQYRELLAEVLETTFTLSALEPQIQQLSASLRPCMSFDPHLRTEVTGFDSELEVILRHIEERGQYLREHLHRLLP